jgi:hypothetical protein
MPPPAELTTLFQTARDRLEQSGERQAGSAGLAYFWAFFAFPSAEQGFSFEQLSPMTPIAWISISIPGRAKFVTVMSALPG